MIIFNHKFFPVHTVARLPLPPHVTAVRIVSTCRVVLKATCANMNDTLQEKGARIPGPKLHSALHILIVAAATLHPE